MNKSIATVTMFIILILSLNPASADTLHFHNGDRITGVTLEPTMEQSVNFRTNFGQELSIPWSKIKNIRKNKLEQATINPPIDTKPELPKENTVTADAEKVKPAFKITGRASFGSSLQTGNSEKSSFNADLSLKTKIDDHRFQAKADFNRAKDEGEITVDKAQAELIYDYFFQPNWFLNSNIGIAQNDISNLDLRATAGLGIGHQAYESDNLNLQYILGATYLNEQFSNQKSEDNISLAWSMDYDQKIFNNKYQIFHEHKLLAPADDIDSFLFESKSGLRIPLVKGIIGTAEIDFDWDNNPPVNTTEEDTIYSMKLGYEW